MARTTLAIGIGAFVVDDAGIRTLDVQPGPRVRAVSTLKPLLAWVAAASDVFAQNQVSWEVLARRSITVSDNQAASELWSQAGEEDLLASLSGRVGVTWQIDRGGEHPSLRALVTAAELAAAYARLASDPSTAAVKVRQWMRDVPAEQAFGVRDVVCDTLGLDPPAVGVKCGWFGGERTHAIALAETVSRIIGAAVMTFGLPDAGGRAAVQDAIGDDVRLVAAHDNIAGKQVRGAMRRALLMAAAL